MVKHRFIQEKNRSAFFRNNQPPELMGRKTALKSNRTDASTKAKGARASWMKVELLIKAGPGLSTRKENQSTGEV